MDDEVEVMDLDADMLVPAFVLFALRTVVL